MLMNKWHLLHLRMKFIPPVGSWLLQCFEHSVHAHTHTTELNSYPNCFGIFAVSRLLPRAHSRLRSDVPENHICHVQCGATVVAQLARCLYYYSRLYSGIHHLVYHFSLFPVSLVVLSSFHSPSDDMHNIRCETMPTVANAQPPQKQWTRARARARATTIIFVPMEVFFRWRFLMEYVYVCVCDKGEFIELNATHEYILEMMKMLHSSVCTLYLHNDVYMRCNGIFLLNVLRELEIQFSFPRMRELQGFLAAFALRLPFQPTLLQLMPSIASFNVIWSCLQCFLHLNFKLKTKSDQTMLSLLSAFEPTAFIVALLCCASFDGYYYCSPININHRNTQD